VANYPFEMTQILDNSESTKPAMS